MKKTTHLQHPPEIELPVGNRPLVAPIYQSVKFEFPDVAATELGLKDPDRAFFYSRRSNPTLRQLELTLAHLQGREEALLTASGVAALGVCLLGLLKQGDHVLCFLESYPPTRYLIRRLLGRFGVTHSLLSIGDIAGVERELAERPTRLMIFESPTNPTLRIADIPRLAALARRYGTLTLLDNTFAGLHNHGQLNLDIYLHSLTKYAGGHGDVMGGAVIADAALIRSLRADATVLGPLLDPHAAFLILRGLKTYFVRVREQNANALAVAKFLATHAQVRAVHYPGLPADPGHALASAQMQDFGSVVTFEIAGGPAAAQRFTDALQLFALAGSVGSTESLVMPPQLLRPHDLTAEQLTLSGLTAGTIRLSLGLEAVEDLTDDLAQALQRACGAA